MIIVLQILALLLCHDCPATGLADHLELDKFILRTRLGMSRIWWRVGGGGLNRAMFLRFMATVVTVVFW